MRNILLTVIISMIVANKIKDIAEDYKFACNDVVDEVKTSPRAAAIIISSIIGGTILYRTNPTEKDYREQHLQHKHKLLMLDSDKQRNAFSNEYIQKTERCFNYDIVRRTTFAFFSIMWLDNYDSDLDLYDARCRFIKVGWLDLPQRIIDFGVFKRWRWIDKAMLNYDNSGGSAQTQTFPPGLARDSSL